MKKIRRRPRSVGSFGGGKSRQPSVITQNRCVQNFGHYRRSLCILLTGLTSEKETVLPDIPSKAFWRLSLPLDDRDVCPVLKEFQVIPARLF